MIRYKTSLLGLLTILGLALAITSCQKLYRPPLGEIFEDPDPPAFNPLKALWAFENNVTDQGESGFSATTNGITYVAGNKGQAINFGTNGYVLVKTDGDTTKHPNGYIGIPKDTILNLGSFTISFWMNVPGPIQDGAQGVFSFSNSKEFWGNFDMFLENHSKAGDPSEVFIKMHMFNDGAANREQWIEGDGLKIPGVLGKWTHIAVTYNAADAKMTVYKDGAQVNTRNLDGGNYGPIKFKDFNGLVLGNHQFQTTPSLTNHGPEGWATSLKGPMDQFRIYNRPLSAGEITTLFNSKD